MRRALFFGDSNTYGYDPRSFMVGRYAPDKRWTGVLQALTEGDWVIIGKGRSGRFIPDSDAACEAFFQTLEEYAPLDLLGIMLGTNDVLFMRQPSADPAAQKMEALLKKTLERLSGKGTKILLIAPPGLHLYEDEDGAFAGAMKELSLRYKEIAEKLGICFADAEGWDLPVSYDGVHLSEEGHRLFAERLKQELDSL